MTPTPIDLNGFAKDRWRSAFQLALSSQPPLTPGAVSQRRWKKPRRRAAFLFLFSNQPILCFDTSVRSLYPMQNFTKLRTLRLGFLCVYLSPELEKYLGNASEITLPVHFFVASLSMTIFLSVD